VGRHQVLPIKLKAECNGTGPTNRQLQGEVGGVTPAGLSLDRAASREPQSARKNGRRRHMLDQFSKRRSASAHVIVLGNEKGGSGKSTVAPHVAVGLLKAGQRVVTIDLDARQQSFTRYINNCRAWAAHTGFDLEVPAHFCIEQGRAIDAQTELEDEARERNRGARYSSDNQMPR
jgi:Mrp family chromosome partitioning ATPase